MKKRLMFMAIAFFLTLSIASGSASASMLESMKDSVGGIKILLMAADFKPWDLTWMMESGQDPDWDYAAKASFIIPIIDREYDATLSGIPAGNYQIFLFAFGESEWDIVFYSPAGLVSIVAGQVVDISAEMLPVGGHYILNLGSGLDEDELSARVSFILGGESVIRQIYFWEDSEGNLTAEVFIPYDSTNVSLGMSIGSEYSETALNWEDAVNGVISITPSFFEGGNLEINIIWPSED